MSGSTEASSSCLATHLMIVSLSVCAGFLSALLPGVLL